MLLRARAEEARPSVVKTQRCTPWEGYLRRVEEPRPSASRRSDLRGRRSDIAAAVLKSDAGRRARQRASWEPRRAGEGRRMEDGRHGLSLPVKAGNLGRLAIGRGRSCLWVLAARDTKPGCCTSSVPEWQATRLQQRGLNRPSLNRSFPRQRSPWTTRPSASFEGLSSWS